VFLVFGGVLGLCRFRSVEAGGVCWFFCLGGVVGVFQGGAINSGLWVGLLCGGLSGYLLVEGFGGGGEVAVFSGVHLIWGLRLGGNFLGGWGGGGGWWGENFVGLGGDWLGGCCLPPWFFRGGGTLCHGGGGGGVAEIGFWGAPPLGGEFCFGVVAILEAQLWGEVGGCFGVFCWVWKTGEFSFSSKGGGGGEKQVFW